MYKMKLMTRNPKPKTARGKSADAK